MALTGSNPHTWCPFLCPPPQTNHDIRPHLRDAPAVHTQQAVRLQCARGQRRQHIVWATRKARYWRTKRHGRPAGVGGGQSGCRRVGGGKRKRDVVAQGRRYRKEGCPTLQVCCLAWCGVGCLVRPALSRKRARAHGVRTWFACAADRQAHGWTHWAGARTWTNRLTEGQVDGQIDARTGRHGQSGRRVDGRACRQVDSSTDGRIDRQTGRRAGAWACTKPCDARRDSPRNVYAVVGEKVYRRAARQQHLAACAPRDARRPCTAAGGLVHGCALQERRPFRGTDQLWGRAG
eukprot:363722-Chlamydomonas_euryale.AAC.6